MTWIRCYLDGLLPLQAKVAWISGKQVPQQYAYYMPQHTPYYGLGIDALVTVCFWNINILTVWAWTLCHRMLLENERQDCLCMDALVTVCSCYGLGIGALEHMSPHALGLGTRHENSRMDAQVTECSWNTRVIKAWARCCGECMLLEPEHYYDVCMDALAHRVLWEMFVWAWMFWNRMRLAQKR